MAFARDYPQCRGAARRSVALAATSQAWRKPSCLAPEPRRRRAARRAGLDDGATQTALWVAACHQLRRAVRRRPWAASSNAGHFVERHGLIVIIALGESIVAIGAGAGRSPSTGRWPGRPWPSWRFAGPVVGLLHPDADAGERALIAAEGHERARLARTCLQLPARPAGAGHRPRRRRHPRGAGAHDEPLDPVFAAAYAGGVALYFAGLAGIRLRRATRPAPCASAGA